VIAAASNRKDTGADNIDARRILEITLTLDAKDRAAAGSIYAKYKAPFLSTIPRRNIQAMLVRDEDVQVLHGFRRHSEAQAYLKSNLFNEDVVTALKPLLKANPEIRIYAAD